MKLIPSTLVVLIAGVTFFTVSCKKDYKTIEEIDAENIQNYISSNPGNWQLDNTTKAYYQILVPGKGKAIQYSDSIPLLFTFKTLDGSYALTDTFTSTGRIYNLLGYFGLSTVRTGVKEILKNRGGQIRFLIPSNNAYGRNGFGDIPGNASLDLTVKALDTDTTKFKAYEDISIQKFMQANNLTGFTKTSKGVYYKIAELGTLSPITKDSVITAEYTAKLFNGTTFDSGTITQKLSQLILGWQQTVPLIKQGGSIRLLIPSRQGYGFNDVTNQNTRQVNIPAFSPLDFTIKITDVSQ